MRRYLLLLLLPVLLGAAGSLLRESDHALVSIEPGSWTRGGEQDADEFPAHDVRISRSFEIGPTEVTQGLYEAVMGSSPAASQGRNWRGDTRGGSCAAHGVGPELPATCVTFDEAIAFCNQLSTREGLRPAYAADGSGGWSWDVTSPGYRLPTEAEWEWAARTHAGPSQGSICSFANVANAADVDHADALKMRPSVNKTFSCEDGYTGLAPAGAVGSAPVRDLLGNLWEWTWDVHATYPMNRVTDPGPSAGPTHGDRVLRGGSWANPPSDLRIGNRFKGPQDGRSYLVGFRIARGALTAVDALPAETSERARRVREVVAAALTAAQLRDAWGIALEVQSEIERTMDQRYEAMLEADAVDFGYLNGVLPGLEWGLGIEGMGVTTVITSGPWTAAAKVTPSASDDAFFALMAHAYGYAAQPTGRPWPSWQVRAWDYGGCSGLGTGGVFETLRLVDAALAEGPEFHPEIKRVRGLALDAVLEGDEYFPYCDPETLGAMPSEKLKHEAESILKRIQLSPKEAKALEARIPALVGAEFQGG